MTAQYNKRHHTLHQPFVTFCDFVQEQSKIRNNHSLQYAQESTNANEAVSSLLKNIVYRVTTNKTDRHISKSPDKVCLIHNTGHSLNKYRSFRMKPMAIRKKILKDKGICFKCCAGFHFAANCSNSISCEICKGRNHPTALHVVSDSHRWQKSHGREQADRSFKNDAVQNTEVKPYCTEICGKIFAGKHVQK